MKVTKVLNTMLKAVVLAAIVLTAIVVKGGYLLVIGVVAGAVMGFVIGFAVALNNYKKKIAENEAKMVEAIEELESIYQKKAGTNN